MTFAKPEYERETKMNHYEQKQEAKRARLQERAESLRNASNQHFQRSSDILAPIPMGQPILVGHHSEGRHRRDLDRAHNQMRKSVEADKRAAEMEERAAAVGTGGISSDDPDAITKLNEKIEKAEQTQTFMKAANKALRKKDDDALRALGLTDAQITKLKEPDFAGRVGFADYQLTNNNANIKRMKQRVAQLEKNRSRAAPEDVTGDGWTLTENVEENRIQFLFDGKPSAEIRGFLKSEAFRWSPRNEAWQRHLNNAGRYAAKCVIRKMEG